MLKARPQGQRERGWRNRAGRALGFSLVELLVVIAVLAVLMVMAAAALSDARVSWRRTTSLGRMRELASHFALYAGAARDMLPASSRREFHRIGAWPGGLAVGQFQIDANWPLLFPEMIDAFDGDRTLYLCPGATVDPRSSAIPAPGATEPRVLASFVYPWVLMSRPEAWEGTPSGPDGGATPGPPAAPAPDTARAGVRSAEVTYASRKVLLWQREYPGARREARMQGPDLAEQTQMVFVDGHGGILNPLDARPGAVPRFRELGKVPRRLTTTAGGCRGIDY